MIDLNKYVGLDFVFDSYDSPNTVNCLTLIRKFYKDNGFTETFDDGKPYPHYVREGYKMRLLLYLINNFNKEDNINNLEYGDIVLLKTNNDINIGVYVDNGKVLTIEIPTIQGKSKSIIYDKSVWKPLIKVCFKRRK